MIITFIAIMLIKIVRRGRKRITLSQIFSRAFSTLLFGKTTNQTKSIQMAGIFFVKWVKRKKKTMTRRQILTFETMATSLSCCPR